MDNVETSSDLSPFVSQFAQYVLSTDRRGGVRRMGCDVAMMFADLAGFTDLAERLGAAGDRGAEELSSILGRHFDLVIGIVEEWGGLVHRFSGDATIAMWPFDDHGGPANAALRATRCGLEIQDAVLDPERSGMPMRQRLSVVVGHVDVAHVGGVNDRWRVLVTGQPWAQVAVADKAAPVGGVTASAQCWSLIAAASSGMALAAGTVLVNAVEVSRPHRTSSPTHPIERDLVPYAPPVATAQAAAGQLEWLGEFRRITSLFVAFDTVDVTDDVDLETLQTLTSAAESAVSELGGSILHLDADDKGLVMLIAIGGGSASDDDPQVRAMLVAQRIHDESRAAGNAVRIGITTGRAFVGLVGRTGFRQYTVHGDKVNVAARLMQAAPLGATLCDERTRVGAAHRFRFADFADLAVKGRAGLVSAWIPGSEQQRSRRSARSPVGRGAQRNRLNSVLQSFVDGPSASTTHLVGPAGIGKSMLLDDLRSMAAAIAGVRVLDGTCDSVRRTDPYAAWRNAIEAAVTDDHTHLLALDDRAALLNPIVGGTFPTSDRTHRLDAAGRSNLTNELLVEVLVRSSQLRPTIVILDDVQWMDSASWQLTELLVRRDAPVMLVLASRELDDEDLAVAGQRLLARSATECIRLGPLDRRGCDELICRIVGASTVSERLSRAIHDRTDGNPLFVEELTGSLGDHLRVHQDTAQLARSASIETESELPNRVEDAVTNHLARLDAPFQLTAKVCSVLGRTFSPDLVAAVHPIEPSSGVVREHLRALVEAGLLTPAPGDDVLMFRHGLIQDAAYGLLLTTQRRELHAMAAEHLDSRRLGGESVAASTLAHHWCRAEVDERAVEALDLASRAAQESFANDEARILLVDAIERGTGLVDDRRLADFHRRLGRVLLNLGEIREAEHHLVDAVSRLHQPFPDGAAGATEILPSIVIDHLAVRRGAHEPAEDPERALAAADCYAMLSEIHYMTHQLELGMYDTLSGANIAASAGEHSAVNVSLQANLAVAAESGLSWLDRPESYRRDALAGAAQLDDPPLTARVLLVVAANELGRAEWAASTDHFTRSMELSLRSGERKNYELAGAGLGNVLRLQGRFREGHDIARQVLDSAMDRGDYQSQVWGLYGLTSSLVNLGRFDELDAVLADFGDLLSNSNLTGDVSSSNTIVFHAVRATTLLRSSDVSGAISDVELAIGAAEATPRLQSYLTCTLSSLQNASFAVAQRSDDPTVQRLPARVQKFTRRCARKFVIAPPLSLLGAGMVADLEGASTRAASCWRRAVDRTAELGMLADLALAHHLLSSSTAIDADERAHHADRTSRVLAELGIDQPAGWTSVTGANDDTSVK